MAAKSPWHAAFATCRWPGPSRARACCSPPDRPARASRVEDDVGAGRQGLLLPGFRAHVFLPKITWTWRHSRARLRAEAAAPLPPSQHGYVLVSKEHAVAGGAVTEPRPRKLPPPGRSPGAAPWRGPRPGGVSAPGGFPHNFGASSQVQPRSPGPEERWLLRPLPCQHGVCQSRPMPGDARVVFHPGGDRHLPARRGRLHQEGGQPPPERHRRVAALQPPGPAPITMSS